MREKVLKRLWNYCIITGACLLYAVAFVWLLQPNGLTVGGFTGIAQVLNRLVPALPVGGTIIVLNVPLFLLSLRMRGWGSLFSSLYAMAVSSVMIDVLERLCSFAPMENLLVACVFGGVLMGAALGILLYEGATTGGTELAARLLKYRFRHISIGRLCMAIDLIVIVAYAMTFRSLDCALYGIITMYITNATMDTVIYGSVRAKMAYIVSDRNQQICQRLLEMDLGVTVLDGTGGWSGREKQVLLCVFKRNQIAALKAAVTELDRDAFIIVCEAYEVFGEGFGTYTADSL